jgi:hypothetical protein
MSWLGSRWRGALAGALAAGAIVLLLTVLSAPAGALSCGDEFTGASGGKWNVAGNWKNGLPTSSTIVCWPAATTVVGEGVDTADSILSGGSLETNGAEVTLADEAHQSTIENLTIDGGHLSGPGPLALTGNFLWTGSGPSGFSAAAAMVLTQSGGGSFVIEGSGQAYDEGGSISTTSPIAINDTNYIAANFGRGTPTLSTTGKVTFAAGEYSGNGGGGLTLEAAGFVTTATTNLQDYNLHLTGNTSSLGGSLTALSFSSQASTSLTVPGGMTLSPQAQGGTISGTVTGAGTFKPEPDGTTIVAKGATLSTADVEVPVGTLTIEKEATYDVTTATTVKGGILEVGDSGKTGDLTLAGGDLGGGPSGGSLAVSGNFLWTGNSELSNPHPLELTQTGGGEFKIEGTGQAYLTGGSISTSSPISITDPEFITTGNASVTTTSVLSFGEGLIVPENGGDSATFTAASVATNKGASYGLNADALVLTGPGTTTVEAGHELQAGRLSIKGGTLADDGTVKPEVEVQGGTLAGSGTVLGAVQVESGTVKPAVLPSKLTVDGVYQQEAGGTLEVEVESESAYSQLVDEETPKLESTTIDVLDKGSFAPKAGQRFEVIATPHHPNGGFDTIAGASGSLYQAIYGETFADLEGRETAPVDTALPQIAGTPKAGETLTCSTGSWSPAPTAPYAYQWNLDGLPIEGATAFELVVQPSDEGHTLTCTVTAADGAGAGTPATSTGVAVQVPVLVPVDTAPPTISGTPSAGQTLTCSTGVWSNVPTGYAYQWSRDGVAIAGATGRTYTVLGADEGHTLTCTVTASNEAGAGGSATSAGVSVPTPLAVTPPVTVPSVPLPLQCSGKSIVLLSVRSSGHSVVLSGLALTKFAGQKVKIAVSDVPKKYAKGKGGSAVVTPAGTFEAKLPQPTGPLAPLTRYTATVAGQSSLGLKLGRTLKITSDTPVAGGAQVSFQFAGSVGRNKHTVTITRQVSCTQEATFEAVALPRDGKLTVTLPAPGGAGAVSYYRAQTRTPAGITYSLPIAVANGG